MNETTRDFSKIPSGACAFVIGEFALGDNGDKAKSAPIRLVARTGKPIEHWFWGNVVHDLAGMRMHKSRIPVDYVHDSKEVVGYLNHFDSSSGDLVATGALVPFKDSDRATEIMHKAKAGVPYEASINFGGDGIKVEELAAGTVAQVNGFQFEGPGIIIREWPLRGVAICPYGADMNTDSSVFASNGKVFAASVITAPEATTKEAQAMSASVEVAAQAETPAAAEPKEEVKPVEVKPVETLTPPAPAEAVAVVEAVKPEGEAKKELSRDEVTKIADEFGAEIAVKTVRDGGDYFAALRMAFDACKKENESLRGRVAELEAKKSGGQAVPVSADKPKPKLFNTGK